ncbi:restriction endonuclease subunit S [Roseivirga sp. BDSF3-8]|uniref:restriction endonuclease subunit S n=1 Tax=Roseivirga sp. BDSF3-8 TaxID=3241598 RepID=UPI0035327051
MSEWRRVTIGDVIEGLYDGPHATPKPSLSGPIFLGIKNITEDGKFDLSGIRHISNEDFPRWTKRILPSEGDIVFTYEATLNRYAIIPKNMQCCLGRRMALLRIDSNKVNREFLFYYFFSEEWRKVIDQNIIVGATVNRIPLSEFESFPLRLPDIGIQEKIASVLSAIDQKIDINNQINQELEAMAKLIYDYWFVQFDFPISKALAAQLGNPALEGKPYKTSGGPMTYNPQLKREIPEGWGDGTFDTIGTIIGGSTPSKKEVDNFCKGNGMPWITPNDLSHNTGNKFITRGEYDVTEKGMKSASLKVMPTGTVLLTSRAPIGYVAIAREDVTTNQGFKSIVPDKDCSTEYVYFTVKSYISVMIQYASGSTFKEISGSTLKMIKIAIPPTTLVEQFTKTVQSTFEKQNNLELQSQKLTELRDWLLPMLMNGQVTVG